MTTKEQAIKNLQDFHWAASQLKLDFCLMDGTLLGAYRDGDFCPGDENDIDVGFLDKDYHRVGDLVAMLKPFGFRSHKDLMFKGRLEGFGLERGDSHFDMIRVNHHPHRPECYNIGRGPHGLMAFVYPSKHHDSFGETKFHGLTFKIPTDPEGFLTARYGDWHTPIPQSEFDWFSQSNRDSIRENYDILR